MKQLYVLSLYLLVFCAPVRSQNALFIPFGQTSQQVKDYLSEKEYIRAVQEDQQLHSLKATLEENKQVEYAFEDGMLYAVTMTRRYSNKVVGKEIMNSCLDYMKLISNGATEQTSKGNVTVYTGVTTARVFKLFITEDPTTLTLALSAVSRQHGPMLRDPNFYFEVELLEKKFNGN
jgi:hypothetical protein